MTSSRRNGVARKDAIVGLFLFLLAYATWDMRVGLPSSLISRLVEPKWLDRDAGRATSETLTDLRATVEEESSFDVNIANHLNQLRRGFESACNHNETTATMDRKALRNLLQGHLTALFTLPQQVEALEMDEDPVKPCRYTFIDLGANIGKLQFPLQTYFWR